MAFTFFHFCRCSLVPVFSFGETDIYKQAFENPEGSFVRKVQDKITSLLTFAPVLFFGRGIFQYSFGILPQRRPIFVAGTCLSIYIVCFLLSLV